ncbi:MAG TPA: TQO small subunit DoxD [Armatimonadota bacterium]|nr:TQO small subunit DoxD [Armatimonadota bacterium]
MAKTGGGGDRHQQSSVAGIVLLRFFLGAFFLYEAITRLTEAKIFIAQIQKVTLMHGSFLTWGAGGGFTVFLQHTVHPHAAQFAWFIMLGGALAGVLFLFGFLTRLASLIAIPISLFFLLATLHGPTPYFGCNAAFLVSELAVMIAAAGRTWGIDALLARNTKVKILW